MKLIYKHRTKKHYIFEILLLIFCVSFLICINTKSQDKSNNKLTNLSKTKFYTKFLTNFLLKKSSEQKTIGRSFLTSLISTSHNFLGREKSQNFDINFFEKSSRTVRTYNQLKLKTYRNTLRSKIKNYRSLLKKFKRNKNQTESKISSVKVLKKRLHLDDSDKYIQFRYYDYEEIIEELNKLKAVENGKWVKIKTAQEEFGLPNPGGYCGKNKE
jgi:hypothetical protein